ncbi:MAG: ParA family protein [Myxococcota bacterium]|jgi:chromosome partitioning protein|nr:ParA family protein [Myxococcota bacterium]
MACKLTLASQKGGVGKTTLSLNLAVAFAERGLRTLLVDLDPQGAVSLALAKDDTDWQGLTELILGQCSAEEALTPTKLRQLTILARGRLDPVDACAFEQTLFQAHPLGPILEHYENDFDYMIVDAPSGVGMVTRACLAVSDFALLPFVPDSLNLRSLFQMLRVVQHVEEHDNQALRLLGIVVNMVDLENAATQQVLSTLWSGFAGVLETMIPRSEAFSRASAAGLPLSYLGGPLTPAARRLQSLSTELLDLIAEMRNAAGINDERGQRQLI